MNTADRSIALVDAALRRRFYFVPFVPTAEPVKAVLGKWLSRYGHPPEPALLLNALNDQIAKDDISIGPSYFMTDPQGGPALERIWARAIMPLLDEYYFGTAWDSSLFALATLRARIGRTQAGSDSAPTAADSP